MDETNATATGEDSPSKLQSWLGALQTLLVDTTRTHRLYNCGRVKVDAI